MCIYIYVYVCVCVCLFVHVCLPYTHKYTPTNPPSSSSEDEEEDSTERLRRRDQLFSKVRHNHFDVVRSAISDGSAEFHGRYSFDDRYVLCLSVCVYLGMSLSFSLMH